VLNGYEILKKSTIQEEKICTSLTENMWLSSTRHYIEGFYNHMSTSAVPALKITFSGPDTGNNEVGSQTPYEIVSSRWIGHTV
jgi:hypothetical protein